MSTEAERRARRKEALRKADDAWHASQTLPNLPPLKTDRELFTQLMRTVRNFGCKFSVAMSPSDELLAEFQAANPDLKFWRDRQGTKRYWHYVIFAEPV